MADNLSDRSPQDRSRISLSEDWEVRYWTQKFGITATDLAAAVREVGNSSKAVAEKLGKSRAA